jgi:hypothetical protein
MSLGARRNQPCPCGSGKKFKLCCYVAPELPASAPKLVDMQRRPEVQGPGIIVLLPTRGRPTVETLTALGHLDGLPSVVIPIPRKTVIDARNQLAATALKVPKVSPYASELGWYALWVDDDAFWRPGTVMRMLQSLVLAPNVDVLAGWFGGRSAFAGPKCYREDGTWPRPGQPGDCEDGDVVEVHSFGFHFVMHRLALLEELGDNPFTVDGSGEPGEDLAFCARARAAGKRLWVHTGAQVAHVDDDGVAYLPGEGPMEVVGSHLRKAASTREYGLEAVAT